MNFPFLAKDVKPGRPCPFHEGYTWAAHSVRAPSVPDRRKPFSTLGLLPYVRGITMHLNMAIWRGQPRAARTGFSSNSMRLDFRSNAESIISDWERAQGACLTSNCSQMHRFLRVVVATAATDQPAATLQIQAREVVLPVTVRDKHGALVSSLQKTDFTLTEDGRPQTIKSFTRETDLPFLLGLLVDTSRRSPKRSKAERKAAGKFVDKMLPAVAAVTRRQRPPPSRSTREMARLAPT